MVHTCVSLADLNASQQHWRKSLTMGPMTWAIKLTNQLPRPKKSGTVYEHWYAWVVGLWWGLWRQVLHLRSIEEWIFSNVRRISIQIKESANFNDKRFVLFSIEIRNQQQQTISATAVIHKTQSKYPMSFKLHFWLEKKMRISQSCQRKRKDDGNFSMLVWLLLR